MTDDQRGSASEANPAGGPPNPFSREGAGTADALGADPGAQPETGPSDRRPAEPAPTPAAPSSPPGWPTYPPTEAQPPEAAPGAYPGQSYADPYGAPPANPQGPYGAPSADPPGQQPPAPSFDPQPTAPYGTSDPNAFYAQPPAAPYASAPPSYGSNPYEVNPYQPSYGGYSPYGVAPIPHPKATPALIFGIVGLVLSLSCGVGGFAGIGGIINGRAARAEIDADPQRYTGRSMASAGWGLGIAGVVIASLVIVLLIILGVTGAFNS